MNLDEVLHGKTKVTDPIQVKCSNFLEMSGGLPLLKNLPCHYEDFRKVKLRLRKKQSNEKFNKTFNEAFDEIPHLRQRAMFANGPSTFIAENGEKEPFYIFPVDGFQFMYSLEVTNSNTDYMEAFDTLLSSVSSGVDKLMEQVLKYSYTHSKLDEGIEHGSEIILFNMPFCYAIRVSSVEGYDEILDRVKK
jgi:hypothetical protein